MTNQVSSLFDPKYEKDSCGLGCIADIHGKKSFDIISAGLQILKNLEHRGANSIDPNAGDGAGIQFQIPHNFLQKKIGKHLPEEGEYAVGQVMLPKQVGPAKRIKKIITNCLAKENLSLIKWRKVPTDNSCLSVDMLDMEPAFEQFIVAKNTNLRTSFERDLYVSRRLIEKKVYALGDIANKFFNISSLSSHMIIYKGMLMAKQVEKYFLDLQDITISSAFAIVHQRYSTNTYPSWGLAQPFSYISHNGEFNTLQGNINWSNSRQGQLSSHLFGVRLNRLFPIFDGRDSDSSAFNKMVELLVTTGRSIEHSLMLLVPAAWENDRYLDPLLKNFYTYTSALVEPWDGPAAILFCDDNKVGALLDRNGLRPLRYSITTDNKLIMASESGVLDIPANKVSKKGKLGPGEVIMLDIELGRIYFDEQIKSKIALAHPYGQWVNQNVINLQDLKQLATKNLPKRSELRLQQMVFGYTAEQLQLLVKPMAEKGEEAVYAMGTDTPLAVLSKLPKNLFYYFHQKFAQVTNPAIDSIRESLVMSLKSIVGGSYNILEDYPNNCHMLLIEQPILTNEELEQLRECSLSAFRSTEISICYDRNRFDLEQALQNLFIKAERMIDYGFRLIVLSDRSFAENLVPIPALLAVSGLHHYLIRNNKRGKVGLIIETGQALEVNHFATLIAFGAGAINPYLAFDTISEMFLQGQLALQEQDEPQENYINAIQKGLKKILAKVGISTLLSYQGAQLFEIIGLDQQLVDKYFCGTSNHLGGVSIDQIDKSLKSYHQQAYFKHNNHQNMLLTGGEYNWRIQGEFHAYNPQVIHLLQQSAWHNDSTLYQRYANLVNNQFEQPWSLRGLLDFNYDQRSAIDIDQVEDVGQICKRFCSGAMSIGAISKEVHEDLAIALNELGAKSNTGEGGEDELRFKVSDDGKLRRSAIKQVASGRFGVTGNYLVNADEIQIKIAQGAKPGEGGQLWGGKVDAYIAKLRHTIPGVSLISPPPHHDIYSIEDLSQLIYDLKSINPQSSVSVKLVACSGVGAVAAGVVKAKADSITISGYDGGTGASPATSIKHAGIPWELGLAETQQTLIKNKLRQNVKLQVDGHVKTGRDVVIAGLLGAEEFGFSTSLLIATGCIMMRKCHLNTCPVGIATQDQDLRKNYRGKVQYIKNYLLFVAAEVRQIMAKLGYSRFEDLVGQADRLLLNKNMLQANKLNIDLSPILAKFNDQGTAYCYKQRFNSADILKNDLEQSILKELGTITAQTKKIIEAKICNADRTVGAFIANKIYKKFGSKGLPADSIKINFKGSAGQSFGAFIPSGLSLSLEGDSNDYVGKGLSGGKISIFPPKDALYVASESSIIGNTCLYGATSGQAFFCGRAGQRFAIRNSGCETVVEGIGDHGCEYMTGGLVVVLGPTGKNFAAGMSGGLAYVYDPDHNFKQNCNLAMVDVEKVPVGHWSDQLKAMLQSHKLHTNSKKAAAILDNFNKNLANFIMVVPFEYRRVLEI